MKKLIGLLLFAALAFGAWTFFFSGNMGRSGGNSSGGNPFSSAKSVSEITGNQSKYDGQDVRVKGTVGKVISIGGRGTYTLNDMDGDATLLVLYDDATSPDQGDQVTVTGTFQEAYNILGKRQGVIIESGRK